MQVPGVQSDAAQVQSTAVAHAAGRDLQLNIAAQPARHPGRPVPGQVGVALLPAGQVPASGTGRQSGVPQLCWLTHTWADVHGAASPHDTAASPPASPPPSEVWPLEPHPTAQASSSAASAPFEHHVPIARDANTPPVT
jgi:hypothetical protein